MSRPLNLFAFVEFEFRFTITFTRVIHNDTKNVFNQVDRYYDPILLLSGPIFCLYPFITINKKATGHWMISIWGQLPPKALEGVYGVVIIKCYNGRNLAARLQVLSAMHLKPNDALKSGNFLFFVMSTLRLRTIKKSCLKLL